MKVAVQLCGAKTKKQAELNLESKLTFYNFFKLDSKVMHSC